MTRKLYTPTKLGHIDGALLTHMRKVAYEDLPAEAARRQLQLKPNASATILKAKAKRQRKLQLNILRNAKGEK